MTCELTWNKMLHPPSEPFKGGWRHYTLLYLIHLLHFVTTKLEGFMCSIKRSMHVHCIVPLSKVLLSQVGSLLFFDLFFIVTGDRFTPHMGRLEWLREMLDKIPNFVSLGSKVQYNVRCVSKIFLPYGVSVLFWVANVDATPTTIVVKTPQKRKRSHLNQKVRGPYVSHFGAIEAIWRMHFRREIEATRVKSLSLQLIMPNNDHCSVPLCPKNRWKGQLGITFRRFPVGSTRIIFRAELFCYVTYVLFIAQKELHLSSIQVSQRRLFESLMV